MMLELALDSGYLWGGALAPSATVPTPSRDSQSTGRPVRGRQPNPGSVTRNPVRPDTPFGNVRHAPARRKLNGCGGRWFGEPTREQSKTAQSDGSDPNATETRLGGRQWVRHLNDAAIDWKSRRSVRHRSSGLGSMGHACVPSPTAQRPRQPNKQRGRSASGARP